MKKIENGLFSGERALFKTKNACINKSVFYDGESPLKESSNLQISECTFKWKYPLWYCKNIDINSTLFLDTARSGIWYTSNIKITNSIVDSPKTFRCSRSIRLIDSKFKNASETLWNCKDIEIKNCEFCGDYLGFNAKNVQIDNMVLNGNYAFDGGENIHIKNSILNSKDSFWNCKNVVVENSKIVGEYLSWNSSNITFIDCEIESHQGLCYMNNITLINCKLINTDLCFEFCKNINAEITTNVLSIKNPISGIIKVKSVDNLILDPKIIDPKKTQILTIK